MKRRSATGDGPRPKAVNGPKSGNANPLTGRAPINDPKSPPRGKSPERTAKELEAQQIALRMTLNSQSRAAIAQRLGCDGMTAARYVARALEEYYIDRNELVQTYVAKGIAQRDRALAVLTPLAFGYEDENGVRHKADMKAMAVYERMLRGRDMLINHGQSIRVEHTGANGGPIMTANIDAREAAAIIRKRMGDNSPMIILSEGEAIPDDLDPSSIGVQRH